MNRSREDFEGALQKLRDGDTECFHVQKDEFLVFREILMAQVDKDRFSGEARKGGEVVYIYMKE